MFVVWVWLDNCEIVAWFGGWFLVLELPLCVRTGIDLSAAVSQVRKMH